jgi:hypothetical protein
MKINGMVHVNNQAPPAQWHHGQQSEIILFFNFKM